MLELLRVLAALKDYSKPHKDQYWRSIKVHYGSISIVARPAGLQDDRLQPLLAYGIARGPPAMVEQALVLVTHCAQNHSFSASWLVSFLFYFERFSCVWFVYREERNE